MLKTQSVTGLKYLCVTRRDNFAEYPGSGTYWVRHLDVHGYTFTTEVLYEAESRTVEFVAICKAYSAQWDIVLSDDFANLMPENGNSSWINTAAASAQAIENHRLAAIAFWNSPEGQTAKVRVSETLRRHRANESPETLAIRRAVHHEAMSKPEYREKLSKAARSYWDNISTEELTVRGRNVSIARLNLAPEKKKLRAERVSIALAESASFAAHAERMKTDRLGAGNPGAKAIMWKGQLFQTGKSFDEFIKANGMNRARSWDLVDSGTDPTSYREVPIIKKPECTCPKCGLTKPDSSSFRRWHFDHCRG